MHKPVSVFAVEKICCAMFFLVYLRKKKKSALLPRLAKNDTATRKPVRIGAKHLGLDKT